MLIPLLSYFLGLAILQFFPTFATISPGVVILPLIIIIVLTALKDGYEDFRRHQADRKVNQSEAEILAGKNWTNPNKTNGKSKTFVRGLVPKLRSRKPTTVTPATPLADLDSATAKQQRRRSNRLSFIRQNDDEDAYWKTTLWEDVRVGDFVRIPDNRPIPADILICATSDPENVAYVETKNLDGETNLKSRNAVPGLTHLTSPEACTNSANTFQIKCDRPENNMYRLNAMVEMGDKIKYPVDLQTVLLRGTVLKNTDWVIGVVMFTGEDSKIVMNAGGTPSKRSRVERQTNPQV